jgi:hypothetical protein
MAFYTPSTIIQVDSVNAVTGRPSIKWDHSNNIISKDNFAVTKGCLTTISGLWMEKFYSETSQLRLTNFNIPLDTRQVVGIEFSLNVQRVARIQDLVIQLMINGQLIGDNRASIINPVQADTNTAEISVPETPINDFNIYGSPSDMWGTTLSSEDVSNPTFGITISFRSNYIIPHYDQVYVDQAAIRITYA